MAAMEINGNFRHSNIRKGIGVENLDFAPPPKGMRQSVSVGGNGWSILKLSKVVEALTTIYVNRDVALGPQLQAVSWPPVIYAEETKEWLSIFEGTHILDAAAAWRKDGHDLMVLPEGTEAWSTANEPLNRAIAGEIDTAVAMKESAEKLNALFAQRPAEWR